MSLPEVKWTPIKGAPAPFYVTCPKCGSPSVCCDAVARWDFEKQDWDLSSTFDDKTCDDCEYEGNTFDETAEADLSAAQRASIFDGEDYVSEDAS